MKKLFVWDFHGVLEKGNEISVIEISNAVLENAGFTERFDVDEHATLLYGKRWEEYFKFLIPGLPDNTYKILVDSCFEYQKEHLEILKKNFKPNDHALEILDLISRKHSQIIISGSKEYDLPTFLEFLGFCEYFPQGYFFGINSDDPTKKISKEVALRRFLFRKDFEEFVIIGDSEADMQLKNIVPIATTYLYSHPGSTQNTKLGDFKINDLRELKSEI
jgi:phosphoglycolate phosphatase-like HAD superfamily hydrolase